MSPQWTSTLGIVFVVLAGVQVWLMLDEEVAVNIKNCTLLRN